VRLLGTHAAAADRESSDSGDKLIKPFRMHLHRLASLATCLGGARQQGRIKHHALFAREVEQVVAATAPPVGFDVTSGSTRLALHVLHELLT